MVRELHECEALVPPERHPFRTKVQGYVAISQTAEALEVLLHVLLVLLFQNMSQKAVREDMRRSLMVNEDNSNDTDDDDDDEDDDDDHDEVRPPSTFDVGGGS